MKVCIINYYYFTNYKAIMHYSEDEKKRPQSWLIWKKSTQYNICFNCVTQIRYETTPYAVLYTELPISQWVGSSEWPNDFQHRVLVPARDVT